MHELEDRIRSYSEHLEDTTPQVGAETARRIAHERARHGRLAPAMAAAGLVVLVIAAVVVLDPFGSEAPFVEEPTTTGPVSTTTVSETTSVPATSTTVAASVELPAISWTRIDDPTVFGGDEYQGMSAVAAGPTGLIAVGGDWDYPGGADLVGIDGALWTSPDGVEWSRVGVDDDIFGGLGDQLLTSIAIGPQGIVVGGEECPNGIDLPRCRATFWVSEDSETWERLQDDAEEFEGELKDIIATEDGFLAVGTAVWISTDGRSWERVFNLESGVMSSIVRTSAGYVAAGDVDEGAAVWVSPNGWDWTAVEDEDLLGVIPYSWYWISDLLDSRGTILGVGIGGVEEVDSTMVWASIDGSGWERILIDRFSTHRAEQLRSAVQVGDWILAAGIHNDLGPHQRLRPYYSHGAILVWGSNDNGATWSVLPDERHVLGNYLSDKFPTWVGDMTLWNGQIVIVGSRGTGEDPGAVTAWDASVWIGTIED